jgi:hypothetical protein
VDTPKALRETPHAPLVKSQPLTLPWNSESGPMPSKVPESRRPKRSPNIHSAAPPPKPPPAPKPPCQVSRKSP